MKRLARMVEGWMGEPEPYLFGGLVALGTGLAVWLSIGVALTVAGALVFALGAWAMGIGSRGGGEG